MSMDGLVSRVDIAMGRIPELENTLIEILKMKVEETHGGLYL
jgi:hypothetical protein